MPVTLVERYNPDWPGWFAQIAAYLETHLHGLPHEIYHMGSTSVPGMTAKPIIDLTIAIDPGSFEAVRQRLVSARWDHVGDQGIAGREVFKPVVGQPSTLLPAHHLYVCERDAYELRKVLAYRDFMRAHPKWRERLSDWKWRLAEALENQRQAYIDGKDAMMREIMRYAGAEASAAEAGAAPESGQEARLGEIAAFLEGYPPPVPEMAASVRGMVRRVLPDIQETLDATSRIVAYGYGPGYGDTICTLIPSKGGVKLGIARGASLPDPDGLLSGTGKVHRVVAFARPSDLGENRPGKEALLEQALAAWRERRRSGAMSSKDTIAT
ncbi:MAG: GrpB family protein [Anaerolineae bacterium]